MSEEEDERRMLKEANDGGERTVCVCVFGGSEVQTAARGLPPQQRGDLNAHRHTLIHSPHTLDKTPTPSPTPRPPPPPRRANNSKGQATNEVLFGGVSLGAAQQESLERMKQTQDRGLDVDV